MIKEKPKITVLLSVFNDEKYVGKAINSILNQTFKDFELLIIDDCSTDKTRDIILGYNDHRIRLIINKKNIGIAKSLNKGLKLARGKYIARTDSDDISYPERLEKQFYFLENNSGYVLVGSRTDVIDESGKHVEYWDQEETAELIFYTLSYRNCLTSSSVMFSKKIVDSLGGYDESCDRAEDYELWYRISRKYKLYTIPEYLVKRRKRENSHSLRNILELNARYRKLVIGRTEISERLLDYLISSEKRASFLEKFSLIKELDKFQVNIKEKGKKIELNKRKLRLVCIKMKAIFIIKIFISKKIINSIKKILLVK